MVTRRPIDTPDRDANLRRVNPAHAPQWSFRSPTPDAVNAFRESQRGATFSYAELGASNGNTPSGYTLDHNRIQIGQGEADFATACAALRAWRMFPAPWTSITPSDAPIREGEIVAMQAHAFGMWWMNACRIVYVLDETTPVRRFGFAYGTLPAHVEQGEERFSVEMLPDGSVWYDIRAFSRPRYWAVRLTKPLARQLQKRFARESKAAMHRAVREAAALR